MELRVPGSFGYLPFDLLPQEYRFYVRLEMCFGVNLLLSISTKIVGAQ
jgi:hypothetical protein